MTKDIRRYILFVGYEYEGETLKGQYYDLEAAKRDLEGWGDYRQIYDCVAEEWVWSSDGSI